MTLPFREIIDLGHEMYQNMPNITGDPVTFWPLMTFDDSATMSSGRMLMEWRMMLMPEHCSTHIDVPRHCVRGGTDVASVPLERLVLPGHLLDLTHKKPRQAITVQDLEQAAAQSGRTIGPGTALLAWTGADVNWGKPGFTTERPYFPVETARWMVEQNITLFDTDLIGMDNPEEWWSPTHTEWLAAGICMVQQMCNLGALSGKEFLLVVVPLKLRDGTGCPVRPLALVL